ncbi:zinc-dependent alcohol dehydrogenase [Desulfitibacter alkalitolerans]|uniref:zinc-dependent alcohol dehydrogenase n=1 Tax=Desulfitibacter alkalitolerans TaxID=264641 RepID=UPI00048A3BD3|nr:alcohol dehydrogenase catalytic domain-containing protein [Desulfitibacter alkalitolerans]
MKAVAKVGSGYGNMSIIDLDKPQITKPDDILIKVKSVGMCGTDLSIYKWTPSVEKEYRPNFPNIIGHEFAGIVESVGRGVSRIKIGDHVTVNEHIFCGICEFCLKNMECICENRPVLGCHIHGGMTEYIVVREKNCFVLPANVSLHAGAIAEPLSVAIHAVERVPAKEDDVVAIIGAGAIGLGLALVLKVLNVKNYFVIGLEQDAMRLELAKEFGAGAIIVGKEDPIEEIQKATGKKGPNIVYECAGSVQAVDLAIRICRPSGSVCLVGIADKPNEIDTARLVFEEKSIVGSRAFYHKTWETTMKMMAEIGNDAEKMVTHRLPMDSYEEALDLIRTGKAIKVIIEP